MLERFVGLYDIRERSGGVQQQRQQQKKWEIVREVSDLDETTDMDTEVRRRAEDPGEERTRSHWLDRNPSAEDPGRTEIKCAQTIQSESVLHTPTRGTLYSN